MDLITTAELSALPVFTASRAVSSKLKHLELFAISDIMVKREFEAD